MEAIGTLPAWKNSLDTSCMTSLTTMNEDVYFKSVKPNLSSLLNEKRNGDNTNRGGNNSKNGGFKYVEIKKKKNRKNNRNSTNNNNNTNRNNHSTNVGVTAVNSSNVEINFDKI